MAFFLFESRDGTSFWIDKIFFIFILKWTSLCFFMETRGKYWAAIYIADSQFCIFAKLYMNIKRCGIEYMVLDCIVLLQFSQYDYKY